MGVRLRTALSPRSILESRLVERLRHQPRRHRRDLHFQLERQRLPEIFPRLSCPLAAATDASSRCYERDSLCRLSDPEPPCLSLYWPHSSPRRLRMRASQTCRTGLISSGNGGRICPRHSRIVTAESSTACS